jgi:hypothetical protein
VSGFWEKEQKSSQILLFTVKTPKVAGVSMFKSKSQWWRKSLNLFTKEYNFISRKC